MVSVSTAEGVFEAMLIPNGNSAHMFEIRCAPFTAGETICQSKLGVLKVNGKHAVAEIVDRLGEGKQDYLLRITLAEALDQPPRCSSTWRGDGWPDMTKAR